MHSRKWENILCCFFAFPPILAAAKSSHLNREKRNSRDCREIGKRNAGAAKNIWVRRTTVSLMKFQINSHSKRNIRRFLSTLKIYTEMASGFGNIWWPSSPCCYGFLPNVGKPSTWFIVHKLSNFPNFFVHCLSWPGYWKKKNTTSILITWTAVSRKNSKKGQTHIISFPWQGIITVIKTIVSPPLKVSLGNARVWVVSRDQTHFQIDALERGREKKDLMPIAETWVGLLSWATQFLFGPYLNLWWVSWNR